MKVNVMMWVLISALVLAIVFGGITVNKTLKYVKKDYESKLSELTKQLEQSESLRQRLHQDGVALHNRYADLLSKDSLLNLELDSIKGRFDHLTGSELQEAMINEHRKFIKK